jgi:hypothetical protein
LPPDACDYCISGIVECEVCDGTVELDDDAAAVPDGNGS